MDKPSCRMRAEAQRAEFPYGWIQFCGPAAIEVASQLRMRKRLISPKEDEAYPIECAAARRETRLARC